MGNVEAEYKYASLPSNNWIMKPMYKVQQNVGSSTVIMLVLDMCTMVCGKSKLELKMRNDAEPANVRCKDTWGGGNKDELVEWSVPALIAL
jgi:hypothetical protein